MADLETAEYRAVSLCHCVDERGHRPVCRRQIGSNRQEVKIRSYIQDGAAFGDADGTASTFLDKSAYAPI
jgi:hypothetical protein